MEENQLRSAETPEEYFTPEEVRKSRYQEIIAEKCAGLHVDGLEKIYQRMFQLTIQYGGIRRDVYAYFLTVPYRDPELLTNIVNEGFLLVTDLPVSWYELLAKIPEKSGNTFLWVKNIRNCVNLQIPIDQVEKCFTAAATPFELDAGIRLLPGQETEKQLEELFDRIAEMAKDMQEKQETMEARLKKVEDKREEGSEERFQLLEEQIQFLGEKFQEEQEHEPITQARDEPEEGLPNEREPPKNPIDKRTGKEGLLKKHLRQWRKQRFMELPEQKQLETLYQMMAEYRCGAKRIMQMKELLDQGMGVGFCYEMITENYPEEYLEELCEALGKKRKE